MSNEERTHEICRFLRGKNGLGTLEGGENPWRLHDTVTTSYTCLCTGEPFGPDEELAYAGVCRAGRDCFVKNELCAEA